MWSCHLWSYLQEDTCRGIVPLCAFLLQGERISREENRMQFGVRVMVWKHQTRCLSRLTGIFLKSYLKTKYIYVCVCVYTHTYTQNTYTFLKLIVTIFKAQEILSESPDLQLSLKTRSGCLGPLSPHGHMGSDLREGCFLPSPGHLSPQLAHLPFLPGPHRYLSMLLS